MSLDELEIGQRIQIKVAYSEADWFPTHIEDLTETEIVIGTPIKAGELVSIATGTMLDCQFPRDDAFYAFQAEVLQRRSQPLPVLVLRRPESVQRFQRRRLFRLPIVLPASYTVPGRESKPQKGNTLDISGGGLCLVAPERLELGTETDVRVSFPDGSVVRAYGRVVKVSQVAGEGPTRYAHGLEFRDLPAAVEERIVSFIFAEQRQRRRREVGRW